MLLFRKKETNRQREREKENIHLPAQIYKIQNLHTGKNK